MGFCLKVTCPTPRNDGRVFDKWNAGNSVNCPVDADRTVADFRDFAGDCQHVSRHVPTRHMITSSYEPLALLARFESALYKFPTLNLPT